MDVISLAVLTGVVCGIILSIMSGPSDPTEEGGRIRGTFAKMRKFRS
tara:strand:+ start:636 stop:776 length:141 start_codon:yes stop_codon:yes gene_type:complete